MPDVRPPVLESNRTETDPNTVPIQCSMGVPQMPRQAKPKDNMFLEMAIVGYRSEVEKISAKISDIQAQLGQSGPKATVTAPTATDQAAPQKRRTISKAGRARIAAAQKARWAAQRKQQARPEKSKKRKLSAAGLKAIREATKKRWAAYHKARQATA